MAGTTGHKKSEDPVNGNGVIQRYINQCLAVAILIFVGIKWIDPVVRSYNEAVQTQAKEIPQQTKVLQDILKQGDEWIEWQQSVSVDHKLQQDNQRAMIDTLNRMCKERDNGG